MSLGLESVSRPTLLLETEESRSFMGTVLHGSGKGSIVVPVSPLDMKLMGDRQQSVTGGLGWSHHSPPGDFVF